MSAVEPRTAQQTRPVPKWALALPVVVVVLATLTAAGLVVLNSSPKTPSVAGGSARVGEKAPGFASWNLTGDRVSLSDFKGKPVLLTFWATWCTACQDELPALQRLRDEYKAANLIVLAVNYRETNNARMSQFLAGLHLDLQTVVDPQGTIAQAYGVDIGLPVNVWLDRSQAVTRIMIGEQPASQLLGAAEQTVGTPPPA